MNGCHLKKTKKKKKKSLDLDPFNFHASIFQDVYPTQFAELPLAGQLLLLKHCES